MRNLWIRNIIVDKFNISNNHIIFEKNKYGKPYLKGYTNINFNISHSGDFVVCAIDDKPIGIDIEEVKHIEYEEIAKSFFTVSEFDYIIKEDLDIQLSEFYEIWTLKESYIKCCGQGLSIPLKSFYINIDKYENIKIISKNEHTQYTLKSFEIESGYRMSICSLNKEISKNMIIIEQNILIEDYYKVL